MDDGEGDAQTAEKHTEEVEQAREKYRQIGRHCTGVDYGGNSIGGIVKAVDHFKKKNKGERQKKADGYGRSESGKETEHNCLARIGRERAALSAIAVVAC